MSTLSCPSCPACLNDDDELLRLLEGLEEGFEEEEEDLDLEVNEDLRPVLFRERGVVFLLLGEPTLDRLDDLLELGPLSSPGITISGLSLVDILMVDLMVLARELGERTPPNDVRVEELLIGEDV